MIYDNVVRQQPAPWSRRVSFVGCRAEKLPFGLDEGDPRCADFRRRLRDTIENLVWQGYRHFISDGSPGAPMWAAELVLEMRQQEPGLLLEMVSPYDSRPDRWPSQVKQRYDRLFEAADIITATGHAWTRSSIFDRNRYLVNNADMLVAAYDGQPGGTEMVVRYARSIGIQVCRILPVVPGRVILS